MEVDAVTPGIRANAGAAIAGAAAPRKALSIFDAVMIVTGIVIGSGIFAFPQLVALMTGSPGAMFSTWILGGLISLIGALCYAELATAFPSAGGDYHFLTLAYGRDLSFFFGWARATVITTGSMALGAFVLGDYLTGTFLSLGAHSAAIYAGLAVATLTAVNLLGLRESARAQNVMTVLLVAGMLSIFAAGVLAPAAQPGPAAPAGPVNLLAAFGTPLVLVLYTYGGWNEAAYISAEVRGGNRAIVKALVLALGLVMVVYLAFVWALYNGLGFAGLQASKVPGAEVARAAFGPFGEKLIGMIAALAAATTVNATLIVGARTNYALGRDWPIVSFMSQWDGRRDVPVRALLVQGGIALVLIVLAAFEKSGIEAMINFTAPVFWFFFLLVGIGLFVLRLRRPAAPRPFRVPFYPVVPMLFCIACAFLFYNSVTYTLSQHAIQWAIAIMLAGFVAWLLARTRTAR